MSVTKHAFTRVLGFISLAIIMLFATSIAVSQIMSQSDDSVDASGTLTDMGFFAGQDLRIAVQSEDDVFAVGEDISLSSAKADHLYVAGGNITASGVELKDMMVAGGVVQLVSGQVRDDIMAAAGKLDIGPGFTIMGSAMLAGEAVSINTPIGGDLRAAAEDLSLKSNVAGDAQLYGENIVIGPNVTIAGDLRYRSESFDMDPAASVTGSITKLEDSDRPDDFEKWGGKAVGVIAAFALAFTIGVILLVCVSAAIFPGLMNSASKMIRDKPLSTIGIGFLIVFAGPAILGLLIATILGIPLALMVGAFYLAAAPLAIAATAYFLGMRGREMIRKETDATPDLKARIVWPLLAVLALLIVGLIPLLGGLVWFVAYVVGMGAIVTRGGNALASAS